MKKPSKNRKFLTKQDVDIWNKIARTAKPLSGRRNSYSGNMDNFELEIETNHASTQPISKLRLTASPVYQPPIQLKPVNQTDILDIRTTRKIKNGKISIDGRLDLHGLTQDDAYHILYERVEEAFYAGKKILLIITGKGNMGRGILREKVPQWLASAQFRTMVSEFGASHSSHGGAGALYVRIRRRHMAR